MAVFSVFLVIILTNNSIFSVLVNPDAFFGGLEKEGRSLRIPALIVFAAAICAAVNGYLVGGPVARLMGGAMPSMGMIIPVASAIGAFLMMFIIWILWTVIIYAITFGFKGSGSLRKMLEFTGYGFIPQIVGAVITIIVALVDLPRVVVPQIASTALQDPAAIQAATKALMHDPAMAAFTQTAAVIGIAFLLWSANIWIFGTKHARMLSIRNAAICVFIPVLVYILYTIYTLAVF